MFDYTSYFVTIGLSNTVQLRLLGHSPVMLELLESLLCCLARHFLFLLLSFPDVIKTCYSTSVCQALRNQTYTNTEDGVKVEKMSNGPLEILRGTFRSSQQRWAIVDKGGFAIVSTFRRLEYLLWGGVRIYTDHRNLAYIFKPEACVSSVPKTAAQRLENWKMVLAQHGFTIMHISDDAIIGGDLLPRWVNVPAVAVRTVVVFVSSAPDETMPSKDVIH